MSLRLPLDDHTRAIQQSGLGIGTYTETGIDTDGVAITFPVDVFAINIIPLDVAGNPDDTAEFIIVGTAGDSVAIKVMGERAYPIAARADTTVFTCKAVSGTIDLQFEVLTGGD